MRRKSDMTFRWDGKDIEVVRWHRAEWLLLLGACVALGSLILLATSKVAW